MEGLRLVCKVFDIGKDNEGKTFVNKSFSLKLPFQKTLLPSGLFTRNFAFHSGIFVKS